MLTPKHIEAQLKRERIKVKKDTISHVTESILHILYESQLFDSSLWPKNGFKAGYTGIEELDTISIIILIEDAYNIKKVRFNIWGKEARVRKQQQQLIAIIDQALYNGIYFFPQYPEHIDRLSAHNHDDFIMAMVDFKFTLDN